MINRYRVNQCRVGQLIDCKYQQFSPHNPSLGSGSRARLKRFMLVPLIAALASLVSTIASNSLSQADIVECNGILTNKPCEEGRKVLTEVHPTPPGISAGVPGSGANQGSDSALMQRWMNDLEIKKIRYQRKYGINLELELVRRACLAGPIELCDNKIKEADRELEEKVLRTKKISLATQQEEKHGDKTDEGVQKDISQSDAELNQTSVTVVNVVRPKPLPPKRLPNPAQTKGAVDNSSTETVVEGNGAQLPTGMAVGNSR